MGAERLGHDDRPALAEWLHASLPVRNTGDLPWDADPFRDLASDLDSALTELQEVLPDAACDGLTLRRHARGAEAKEEIREVLPRIGRRVRNVLEIGQKDLEEPRRGILSGTQSRTAYGEGTDDTSVKVDHGV